MKSDELIAFLQDHCLQRREDPPFTLSGGLRSCYYIDKYQIYTDWHMTSIAASLVEKIIDPKANIIVCPELGGAMLGIAVCQWIDANLAIVRLRPKHYGLGKQIEGASVIGRQVAVVDDIVTTGDTMSHVARTVTNRGGRIIDRVCLIRRIIGDESTIRDLKAIILFDETTGQFRKSEYAS